MATSEQPAFADPKTDAPELEAGNICFECGGSCCSFKTLNIGLRSVEDTEKALSPEEASRATIRRDIPENLIRQSGEIVDMDWYYEDGGHGMLRFDCNHLTDEGKCGIYNDRPELCRAFECDVLNGRDSLSDFLDRAEPHHNPEDLVKVTDAVNDEIRILRKEGDF